MTDAFERARRVARRLQRAGHEAYFAGGCVRDHLLGRPAADVDIATSARPDEVQRLFRRTIGVGRHFGVIIVLDGDESFDVATFRTDGHYGDGRHPDGVEFSTAEDDVKRRDFTINGLLMDPCDGHIIDFVGGRADLEAGVVRTIGNATQRFTEDHLRILRAVRFAARLDFRLDETTAGAIRAHASLAATPSAERVRGELDKMLTERDPAGAVAHLVDLDLLPVVLPEVAAKSGVLLPPRLLGDGAGPAGDALTRTRRLLARLPARGLVREWAWAVLLEDQVQGPPRLAARRAEEVLERLRSKKALTKAVGGLVTARDRLLFARRVSPARRRLLAAHDRLDLIQGYAELEAAEASPDRVFRHGVTELAPAPLPPPLLRGDELVAAGVPPGRAVGRVGRRLRQLQLQGRLRSADDARRWLDERMA